ncbi:MAG: hypothetical protein IIC64_10950 [SAR324 cluster bacterium]|nr:hypothetical protein [SAR324 cluster bacterium]
MTAPAAGQACLPFNGIPGRMLAFPMPFHDACLRGEKTAMQKFRIRQAARFSGMDTGRLSRFQQS